MLSRLLDGGAAAPDVQAVLGHSSLQVTKRYSRAREGVAKRAGSVIRGLFDPEPDPKHKTPKKNKQAKQKSATTKKNRGDAFSDPFGTNPGHHHGPNMTQNHCALGM